MKWIKLFEDFKNSNEVWPLLGVYSHYDYTGPIKGGDVIKEGFQSLVEKNAFLRAWFDDYGKSFDDDIGDYDIFDDDFFWGHTDENISLIIDTLKSEGIVDVLWMDLSAITFAEILNRILASDPSFKKDFDAEDEESSISQGIEDLSFLIDYPKVINGIKKARKKAIEDLMTKGHNHWRGMEVQEIEELKSNPDFPPYKYFIPMQSGIDLARRRYPLSRFPWDNSIS